MKSYHKAFEKLTRVTSLREGDTMRVGIVGCGLVANEVHIPTWLRIKDVEIVAVCDRDENRAEETAKRFRIRKFYRDFPSMLKMEKIDIVDICTPVRTHASLSVEAMNAGCHILVEKPMATSVSDADKMVAASKKNNVKLCVIHNSLFNPVVQKAKRLFKEGVIGDLIGVEARYLVRRDESSLDIQDYWYHSLPGGIFGEIAPHPVYLILAFLRDINSVYVVSKKFSGFPWVRADELKVLLDADNAVGAIFISCNSPSDSITVAISGSKMILHIDLLTQTIVKYKPSSVRPFSLAYRNLNSSFQLILGTTFTAIKALFGKVPTGHSILIPKFAESIRNNTEPPVTGEEGRETVRILEKIWQQIDRNIQHTG